jgi:hypothetical protein
MSTASLYEKDFCAWTEKQAELLRRLPPLHEDWFPSPRVAHA